MWRNVLRPLRVTLYAAVLTLGGALSLLAIGGVYAAPGRLGSSSWLGSAGAAVYPLAIWTSAVAGVGWVLLFSWKRWVRAR